tara:strand:- start:37336 stop:37674 length:339 start_codon:yes stop_codon:yes gene_type:complete
MKRINIIPKPKYFRNREKIILRDFLAMERTSLANERTLFSYIRASLYMAIGGVAILEYEGFASFNWLSYVVFGLSFILIFIGIFRYRRLKKKLDTYYRTMNIVPEKTQENPK